MTRRQTEYNNLCAAVKETEAFIKYNCRKCAKSSWRCTEMYDEYNKYCASVNVKPLSRKAFNKKVESCGPYRKVKNNQWQWIGIRPTSGEGDNEHDDEPGAVDFLRRRCISSDDRSCACIDMWTEYLEYCRDKDIKPASKKVFSRCVKLQGHSMFIHPESRQAMWQGINLRLAAPAAGETTVGAFIRRRCILDEDVSCMSAELYSKYLEYCREEEITPLSQTKFNIKIERRGMQRIKHPVSRRKMWKGIKIRATQTKDK